MCLRQQWTLLPMLGLLPLSPSMRLGLSALLHPGSNTRVEAVFSRHLPAAGRMTAGDQHLGSS